MVDYGIFLLARMEHEARNRPSNRAREEWLPEIGPGRGLLGRLEELLIRVARWVKPQQEPPQAAPSLQTQR
jgi:hypothetical protein